MKLLPQFAESLMPARPALALILKGWCKHNYAQDLHGNELNSQSPAAVAWCSFGAIRAAYGDWNDEPIYKLSSVVDRAHYNVPGWNDDRATTHQDVIQAFYSAGI